eukprot:3735463-Prymnesium_polylepis.2
MDTVARRHVGGWGGPRASLCQAVPHLGLHPTSARPHLTWGFTRTRHAHRTRRGPRYSTRTPTRTNDVAWTTAAA